MRARLVNVADGVVAAFGVYTGRNRLRRVPMRQPAAVLAARVLRRGFLLCTAELTAIAAMPHDIAVPGLDRARATPRPAPVSVPPGGRGTKVLGKADVGGHAVAVNVADSRQHLHVLGSTGSGKSTLLLNMILDDIHARRGTIVIDPKGDLVIDLLDRIPARFADRLVIIDPDPARPEQSDVHNGRWTRSTQTTGSSLRIGFDIAAPIPATVRLVQPAPPVAREVPDGGNRSAQPCRPAVARNLIVNATHLPEPERQRAAAEL
ncbi:helicase HerA domain-containing protein [Dactylosporangium cerinum]|uniref:Helicase HerA domain-containing protein n=1 Tax=Dactylosporangium cerinum TaxID=1434730 RepID=A0ABV9WFH3_9ACTN